MRPALLFASLLALVGCHSAADDIRPINYDKLAMATGHWEWESTVVGFGSHQTPAKVGYTRQLVFTADEQVIISHNNHVVSTTPYQLSMGTLAGCGAGQSNSPIITFETEAGINSAPRKAYRVTQSATGLELSFEGDYACVDGGAYESYHWVDEQL